MDKQHEVKGRFTESTGGENISTEKQNKHTGKPTR
jgi:hypothetical protein